MDKYHAPINQVLGIKSIENNLDVFAKYPGGGVIKGWNVYQNKSYHNSSDKKFVLNIG